MSRIVINSHEYRNRFSWPCLLFVSGQYLVIISSLFVSFCLPIFIHVILSIYFISLSLSFPPYISQPPSCFSIPSFSVFLVSPRYLPLSPSLHFFFLPPYFHPSLFLSALPTSSLLSLFFPIFLLFRLAISLLSIPSHTFYSTIPLFLPALPPNKLLKKIH